MAVIIGFYALVAYGLLRGNVYCFIEQPTPGNMLAMLIANVIAVVFLGALIGDITNRSR